MTPALRTALGRHARLVVLVPVMAAGGCASMGNPPQTDRETTAGAVGGALGAAGGAVGGAAIGALYGLQCGIGFILCSPVMAVVGAVVGAVKGGEAGAHAGVNSSRSASAPDSPKGASDSSASESADLPASAPQISSPVTHKTLETQTALTDPTRASDTRPADALPKAGASWQYAYTMRGIGSARFTFGVRVSGVVGDVVHEIITIPSSPERIVSISADSLSLRTLQLPQSQTLVELAPYLHSILAKNETRSWGALAGYPAGNNTLAPWILAVRESGQEEVTVPAGTFKTTRIEVSGRRVTTPPAVFQLAHESGRFLLRAWYAPQVRRYVRLQHETWPLSGAPPGVQLVELIGYTAN